MKDEQISKLSHGQRLAAFNDLVLIKPDAAFAAAKIIVAECKDGDLGGYPSELIDPLKAVDAQTLLVEHFCGLYLRNLAILKTMLRLPINVQRELIDHPVVRVVCEVTQSGSARSKDIDFRDMGRDDYETFFGYNKILDEDQQIVRWRDRAARRAKITTAGTAEVIFTKYGIEIPPSNKRRLLPNKTLCEYLRGQGYDVHKLRRSKVA